MCRAVNILVLIIVSFVVLSVCILNITGLIGGIRSPIPEEWADFLKYDGQSYLNTYNTLDEKHLGRLLGKTEKVTPKGVDMSEYVPANLEAAHLASGTVFYSIDGFDCGKFIAVKDGAEYFLYAAQSTDYSTVLSECGKENYRAPVDFSVFCVPTSVMKSSEEIRFSVIGSYDAFEEFISDKSKDFKTEQGSYTYTDTVEARGYDKAFFKDKMLVAIRLPSDGDRVVYDISSLTAEKTKMNFVLKRMIYPDNISFDSCLVRYLFVEFSSNEYSGQKITYQIEPVIIPDRNRDRLALPSTVIKLADEIDDIAGTKYSALLGEEFDRDFFDTNLLFVIALKDGDGQTVYSTDKVLNERGFININIFAYRDEALPPDSRVRYLYVSYPKADYNGELVMPVFKAAKNGPVKEQYSPRDCLVVQDTEMLDELKKTYDIPDIYEKEFFENHVLLFVGDVRTTSSSEYGFGDCTVSEGRLTVTVEETLPRDCDDLVTVKYVAVPYLRTSYHDEPLEANLVTVYDFEYVPPVDTTDTLQTTDTTAQIPDRDIQSITEITN